MDNTNFQKMNDEELLGTIESNANAQRALPGGSISLVMLLDELKRRLEGGKQMTDDDITAEKVKADKEAAEAATATPDKVTKSKDKVTTSESFEKI